MTTELNNFLELYKSTGQKDENGRAVFTHTSLLPKAAYNIPSDKRETLHRLMAEAIYKRKAVYLTERPNKIKPVTIDIDLKYNIDCSTRQHNESHILVLLRLYGKAISQFVDMPTDKQLEAYVFQRSNPYPLNGNMKDGIHILYPNVCIDADIQHVIRTEVLKNIDQFIDNVRIGSLPVKNTPDAIIDNSVISATNWMMYGNMKPALLPYKLYGIYGATVEDITNNPNYEFQKYETGTRTQEDIYELINHLSIHNVTDDRTFTIKDEYKDSLDEYISKTNSRRQRNKYNSSNVIKNTIKNINDDENMKCLIEEAIELTALLADWRAEAYNSWIEVGLCLHNISHALEDTWIEFSKRSDAFNPNIDGDRWYKFSDIESGLNIGSLHRWARLDNPQKYKELQSKMLRSLMMCSISGSSQDVAAVVYKMYKHQYVCIDAKGHKWAEFVNHSWNITNEGISLKKKIGNDILNEYLLLITYYNTQALEKSDEQKDPFLQRIKSLSELTYKLRDISFKDKVMKECVIMFHDPTFEESLNSNPHLVGLDNGVYDLKRGVFRDGQPEDRVSITTGNDYPEFDENDINIRAETSSIPAVQAIYEFMQQVFPIASMRLYMFLCLASYLEGYNREEKFHLWSGVGGNGKSKLLALFELAFGGYCFKLPINILTKSRSQPGQATPELVMGIGRRFGSLQEPDEGAKVNSGMMKELSGNDKLYWRGLYSEGGIMKPQFSLVLLCNHKPKMTSDDDGSWRRLVVIEFLSKFVEGLPKNKYEFPRNIHLDQMFPEWAPYFFALLTLYYKTYKEEGLAKNVPKEVVDATYEYRKQSDAYALFMDDYFCEDETGVVKLENAYTVFKEWFYLEFSEKPPARGEFKAYVEKKLNKPYGIGSKSGWYGYAIRHPESGDRDVMNEAL